MAKFIVTVTRLQSQVANIEVEAISADQASEIAYDTCGDHVFRNCGDPMDYEVESVEEA